MGGSLLWLVSHALKVELPSQDCPVVFYSNQKRNDLKLLLCEALRKARSSILIHIYSLNDPDIMALLKQKRIEGVDITIFHDKSASAELEAEFEGKLSVFPIRSTGLMHRKILVLDRATVYIGSANFTPQSLRMHDNLVIGIKHPPLAEYIKNCPKLDFSFQLQDQHFELYFLPDFEKKAISRLIQIIESAKHSISIAMFTLTHPLLTEKLIEAHKRGVTVKAAVDFFTGHGSSAKTIVELQKAGIKIYLSQGDALLHHKWALIDKNKLAMGSANWTAAAFKNNHDCLLILNDLKEDQRKFLLDLWNIIESDCIESNYEDLLSFSCPFYFDGPHRQYPDFYCCFKRGRSQKADKDYIPRAYHCTGCHGLFLLHWRLPA